MVRSVWLMLKPGKVLKVRKVLAERVLKAHEGHRGLAADRRTRMTMRRRGGEDEGVDRPRPVRGST